MLLLPTQLGTAAPSSPTSLWQTAAVAAGSATLGACVGGCVSYLGNLRLNKAQRRLRAAVRRKAKIYVPLKLELQELRSNIEEDRHFNDGIDRTDRPDYPGTPTFVIWPKLVEDGRASFAASTAVRKSMEALEKALADFLRVRGASGAVFERVGHPLFAELTGNAQYHTTFGSTSMADVLRDKASPWRDWEWESSGETRFPEFRTRFNDADGVDDARRDLSRAEDALKTALAVALASLDSGIRRISRREEKEAPRD